MDGVIRISQIRELRPVSVNMQLMLLRNSFFLPLFAIEQIALDRLKGSAVSDVAAFECLQELIEPTVFPHGPIRQSRDELPRVRSSTC